MTTKHLTAKEEAAAFFKARLEKISTKYHRELAKAWDDFARICGAQGYRVEFLVEVTPNFIPTDGGGGGELA